MFALSSFTGLASAHAYYFLSEVSNSSLFLVPCEDPRLAYQGVYPVRSDTDTFFILSDLSSIK